MSESQHNLSIERLERRMLLAWSDYAQLIGQDRVAADFPSLLGAGQSVAVIDTGIDYTHPALGGGFGPGKKVVAGWDFVDSDADPKDTDGHGTRVAGLIAANDYTHNGVDYRGIAPDASLVALRVGGGTGGIPETRIEQALKWVIANRATYNITVVSFSLSGGAYTSPISSSRYGDELATLRQANVFIVAASGNSGQTEQGIGYPSADPNVFSTAPITGADVIAPEAQRGPMLDLLAPGINVASTNLGGGTMGLSGSSYSSPITAGAAVLLRQADPNLTGDDIASILRTSGRSNFDGDTETGVVTRRDYPRLDLHAAVVLAMQRSSQRLTTLPTTGGTALDVATDHWGTTHLAYYDPASSSLRYTARGTDGKWSTPVVVDGQWTDCGSHLSIAIDQAGKPQIAYFDATYTDLKFARFDGTSWITRRVDRPRNVGQFPSLAFDAENQPLISYHAKSGGNLKLARWFRDVDSFARSTPDSVGTVGRFTSIAFEKTDAGNTLAIAYADDTNGNLKYYSVSSVAGTFNGVTTAVVDDLDGVANIDLRLKDHAPSIAYRDTLRGDVRFASRNSAWSTETVASAGSVGLSLSLLTDASNRPSVAYYSRTLDATYLATRLGTNNWSGRLIGSGGYALSADNHTRDTTATLVRLDAPRSSLLVTDLFA
jgi:hypothetical protein